MKVPSTTNAKRNKAFKELHLAGDLFLTPKLKSWFYKKLGLWPKWTWNPAKQHINPRKSRENLFFNRINDSQTSWIKCLASSHKTKPSSSQVEFEGPKFEVTMEAKQIHKEHGRDIEENMPRNPEHLWSNLAFRTWFDDFWKTTVSVFGVQKLPLNKIWQRGSIWCNKLG